jgi:hypothetical protein
MRDVIAFDFDGTLIDLDPIGHLWGDWDNFHVASFDCPAREGIVALAKRMQLISHVVVVTGKPDAYRSKMIGWLSLHGIMPDELLMRPAGSMMPDAELKPALMFDCFGPDWKDRLIAVIEDRDKMVDAWRAEGVTCLQAASCIETRIKKGTFNANQ